jgi:hypothetical protein
MDVATTRGVTAVLSAAAILWLGLTSSAQGVQKFRARLSPVPIDAAMMATVTGSGSATAELAGTRLSVNARFDGLRSPATVARLHLGQAGVRGPAIVDLTATRATSGTVTGNLTLTALQADDLRKGRVYLQLHSEKAPDGNLWGWFFPEERRP